MQEHPVPQNVTSFEFKLIGDMTLRQFGYVGTGAAIALATFFMPLSGIWLYLFKFPVIFLAPVCGFALAFVPVEGRPLDRWFVSFLRAVFGNTLYVWKKEGTEVSVLHNMPMHQIADPAQQTVPAQPAIPSQIHGQPQRPVSPLDALEQQSLRRLNTVGQPIGPLPVPQVQQPPQAPVRPMPAVPHTPRMTAFAGTVHPANQFSARPTGPVRSPMPTLMREPYQKPLAPKKIALPSYQQANINRQNALTNSATQTQAVHIAQPVIPPGFRPTNAVQQLELENQQLRQRLSALEKRSGPASPDLTKLKQDDQLLHSQMATMQSMVTDYQKQLVALATDEEKYQSIIADITSKLEKSLAEKQAAAESANKLTQDNEAKQAELTKEEQERQELETQLKQLQDQLATTKSLLTNLQEQKTTVANLPEETPTQGAPATPPSPLASLAPSKPITIEAVKPAPVGGETSTQPTTLPSLSQLESNHLTPTAPVVNSLAELQSQLAKETGPIQAKAPKPLIIEPVHEKPAGPAVDAASVTANTPALTTIPNAISGYTFDANRKPVTDVIVVVKKPGGSTLRALKTNRVGQFSMVSPLPDGKYDVQFEKDGYGFPTVAVEAKGAIIPPISVEGKPA